MNPIRRWLYGLVLLAPLAALAEGPFPLQTQVGKTTDSICKTGTIICPAGAVQCDDTSIALPVGTDEGLAFKGVAPGTTLCSAGGTGGMGLRAVYRVTVTAETK